jgi:23S rRNA pseudouridine2605 synthase
MNGQRLQKYLAQCGVASRRKAEELIKQGRVSVNGSVVNTPGIKVIGTDKVYVDGELVTAENRKVYIALNKPVGYVTTVKDQFSRKTVIDIVGHLDERVYPVGRLDYDTSGLIFLTNDGDFTYKLTHPKHKIDKVYVAELEGIVDQDDINAFSNGIKIENFTTSPAVIKVKKKLKSSCVVEIIIHEGKNRQVRKMCDAIGHPVISLKRVAIGSVDLKGLPEGKWRFLKQDEIRKLMN